MTDYQSFETIRLWIKPISEVDAIFLLELLNTPTWIQNIGDRGVKTVEQARQYIENRMKPQWERLGFGNFVVVRKEDDTKIGVCGLFDRDGIEGFDIGFALLPQFEKKGYAFEAAQKILAVGKESFGIEKVKGITTEDNVSSRKLLEKLGLRYTKNITIPNDDAILMLFE